MLFNSYIFIFLFFPLVVLGYYAFHHFGKPKMALGYLLCMSMWFYGYNSIKYLFILIASVILNYLLVELLDRTDRLLYRRLLLIAGIGVNIGILFYYKYYDFFIENVNKWFKTDYALLRLMLPLGISFYTFQQLSYVVDSYRRECEKYGFLEYAAYVIFFPQLIAGPIVYHDELIPQLRDEQNHRINYENLSKGLYAFSLGLAKKVLVADTLSKIVTWGYDNKSYQTTLSCIIIMLCYTLQIYFDFSGYCDMAYGIGYLFNIKLPFNFNSPYKANSISEFWDRWHMTLTRFFTKYVYIPLGGSRKGKIRTYINIFIVFLVSGLWHGANWTYILWGTIHGIAKIFDRIFERILKWIPNIIRRIVTFVFVAVAWSLFRSENLKQFKRFWKYAFRLKNQYGLYHEELVEIFNNLTETRILYRIGFGGIIDRYPLFPLVAFIVLLILACFFMKNTQEKVEESGKYSIRRLAVTVVMLFWSIMSLSDVSEFLYFNF
ncbi:MAG: MBOAT family protein [Lachnospiraceae bacterium]|nr:MBOAT family protein [Lachnospiraceae bacterium]